MPKLCRLVPMSWRSVGSGSSVVMVTLWRRRFIELRAVERALQSTLRWCVARRVTTFGAFPKIRGFGAHWKLSNFSVQQS